MPLPESIIANDDPIALFEGAGAMIDEYAERLTGEGFDPAVWEKALAPIDFHLAMLDHFLGTWENSGSFVNEARSWWDEEARVKTALITFGCGTTAAMFDEAAELGMQIANRYDSGHDITAEQKRQREEMNRLADEDVSYEKLAAFIRQHKDEFLQN